MWKSSYHFSGVMVDDVSCSTTVKSFALARSVGAEKTQGLKRWSRRGHQCFLRKQIAEGADKILLRFHVPLSLIRFSNGCYGDRAGCFAKSERVDDDVFLKISECKGRSQKREIFWRGFRCACDHYCYYIYTLLAVTITQSVHLNKFYISLSDRVLHMICSRANITQC